MWSLLEVNRRGFITASDLYHLKLPIFFFFVIYVYFHGDEPGGGVECKVGY